MCRDAVPTLRSQRPITATTHIYTRNYHRIAPSPQPSPILWGNHCGSDDRDCHAHTHIRRTIVPKEPATPLTPAVYQGPTSRRCGHARRRPAPTPRGYAQSTHTHTAWTIVLCVSFGDPHVHNGTTSDETKQECSHSSANTLGPVHHMARTHQADDKSKEGKRKSFMSTEFCVNTDPCSLASPRVATEGHTAPCLWLCMLFVFRLSVWV